jgi:conjugative relaxase-like TrwC/TraI family protein
MTTIVSLRSGHDVRYFTNHGGVGGCAGAMAYYTKADEPPGQWHGKGAARLGLTGEVDPQVIDRLFMDNIGPNGEVLAKRRRRGGDLTAADKAVKTHVRAHPFASSVEVAEVRSGERAKATPKSVPYFDLTVSAVKSVSVLHASYRVAAMQARARGADDEADTYAARADAIEHALMDAARDAVDWMEMHACFTRTGYHSSTTGEWRDGAGLTTSLFLHHLSRDGDPQLHVHVAIWNRTQRADGADDKWRTLFGRSLYSQGPGSRLGAAPVPDRFLEARLRAMGLVMVPREDGNGCEIGGVDPAVMARFSSRSVSIGPELAELAAEYERMHGKPPSQRTLWLLHQQAGQNTRRTKAEARRTVGGQVGTKELTPAERLAAWEQQTTAAEMHALSAVHEQAEQFARDHAPGGAPHGADLPGPVPGRMLDDAAKRRAARIAVAEVQKHHSAWGMAELRFEVHRALGPGATGDDVTEVAYLAISGRCGTGVVQIGAAPDITNVDALGVRASDGVSVYRPPGTELWCTLDHLDLEEHIVSQAKVKVRQRVSVADAKAAVAKTDLTADQADAVVAMLTSDTMTVPLNAAAGSGKSHTMAVFSKLWTQFTGARVIGLTTSTNASYVLQNEGLAESYNIAQFLGKVKDSDNLRYPVKVNSDDVLVLDEATQASTADFALVQQAARHAGARLHPVGDTHQLGAVEAGGIFSLLVTELGGPQLEEILRFRRQWEAEASAKLRKGDITAHAAYDRRGRIYGADHDAIFNKAATGFLADLLRGRNVLLEAASSAEASDLARRVQAQLIAAGRVEPGEVELSDGNCAGAGDLIRARLNTYIDAGGRKLTNRDTLRVTKIDGDQLTAQRKIGPDAWSPPFTVPAEYVTANAELDYAGNAHVAEGRTVDVSHSVVTQTTSRRSLYVMMTRGREENFAYVETGNTAPQGRPPYEQATVEAVLKGVMEREAEELSATEQMRQAQEWAGGAGHVMHLWSTAVRARLYPEIDRRVMARLTPDQAQRYEREFSRAAFHARMREAQLAGHDIGDLIDRITADSLDGARSVSSVLHSRLAGLGLDAQHDATWSQRTPAGTGQMARELAEGLDDRTRELGQRAAARPLPWLAKNLGLLAPDASPALRAEYERRAGIAAAYREAAGITDPNRDISPEPHEGNPELETWRKAAARALEIRDEAQQLRSMTRAQLEARVAEGERAMATAPPDVSAELRAAARAKADAWAQHADAQVRHDEVKARGAGNLADMHAAQEADLEGAAAAYEHWSALTAEKREVAGNARAELHRRDAETPDWPDDWWSAGRDAEVTADVDAVLAVDDLESAIPGEVWEQARQLQAKRIAQAKADRVERLREVMREYQTEVPDSVLEQAQLIREQRIGRAAAKRAGGAQADPEDQAEPEPDRPSAYDARPVRPGPEGQAESEGPASVDMPQATSNDPAGSVDREPEDDLDAKPHESWTDTKARLDAAQARVQEVADRVKNQQAEDQASADYFAQKQSEARREPEATPELGASWQDSVPDADMEIEA